MSDSDRYQNRPWPVRMWRRRHYLGVPLAAFRFWWEEPDDSDSLTFGMCWGLAIGIAQIRMNWVYDWTEVKDRLEAKP